MVPPQKKTPKTASLTWRYLVFIKKEAAEAVSGLEAYCQRVGLSFPAYLLLRKLNAKMSIRCVYR